MIASWAFEQISHNSNTVNLRFQQHFTVADLHVRYKQKQFAFRSGSLSNTNMSHTLQYELTADDMLTVLYEIWLASNAGVRRLLTDTTAGFALVMIIWLPSDEATWRKREPPVCFTFFVSLDPLRFDLSSFVSKSILVSDKGPLKREKPRWLNN